MTTQTQQKNNFFNLHTSGIGYLNNIREVQPEKGAPYLSCTIAALTGESANPNYRYFNVNVTGAENENLIRRCHQAVAGKKKVLIAFTLSDMWTELFTYEKNSQYHQKGDAGVMLKARLIRIRSISIDGQNVYQESKEQQFSTPAQKSAPQYQSEQMGDADFENTPPKHQQYANNQRNWQKGHPQKGYANRYNGYQKQSSGYRQNNYAAQNAYPADSF